MPLHIIVGIFRESLYFKLHAQIDTREREVHSREKVSQDLPGCKIAADWL